LIGSMSLGVGNKALLCSGFFQELFKNHPYQASTEQNLSAVLVNHSIELTTIGIHNNCWMPSYKSFRNSLRSAGVNLRAMYTAKFHWHAKVFILRHSNDPVLAIVGSSNITRNAFSDSDPFNYEADVIMWLDAIKPLTKFIERNVTEIRDEPHEVIIADYDPKKNNDLLIKDRLIRLDTEMKELELKELPE